MLSTNQTIWSLWNCEELYFNFPFDTFTLVFWWWWTSGQLQCWCCSSAFTSFHLFSRSSDFYVTLSSCWTVCFRFKFSPRCLPAMKASRKAVTECFLFIFYQIKCFFPGAFLFFNIYHWNKPPVRQWELQGIYIFSNKIAIIIWGPQTDSCFCFLFPATGPSAQVKFKRSRTEMSDQKIKTPNRD